MNTNEFNDMTKILQAFSEEVTTQFVNIESIELDKSEMSA